MKIPATVWAMVGATAVAISSIGYYEGYRGTSYNDGVGRWTLGYGSTVHRTGESVKPDQTTTEVEALRTLQWHADKTAIALAKCIGDVPLAKHEWDAYVSWAYNVGITRACQSTLVKLLQEQPPKYEAACRELLRWTRAGGREFPGLVKRRTREYELCSGRSSELAR